MNKPLKKTFNINEHWRKCCIYLDELGNKNSFYWLDTKSYKIIGNYHCMSDKQKAEIDSDSSNRFITLPQYLKDSRYKELTKELNDSNVSRFFAEAKSEEEAHFRYRCFVDWNGLAFSECYKNYLTVSRILINWCNKNNIKYSHKHENPPKNYVYDGRNLNNEKWLFFYEDVKSF